MTDGSRDYRLGVFRFFSTDGAVGEASLASVVPSASAPDAESLSLGTDSVLGGLVAGDTQVESVVELADALYV